MEETNVKNNVRDEMKKSMESLCKIIDDFQDVEKVILHHLQSLVEKAIDNEDIEVEAAPVEFFNDEVCKDAEFKIILMWEDKRNNFGLVIWLDTLQKIRETLNISNLKIISNGDRLELYISFFELGIAVGCDKDLFEE